MKPGRLNLTCPQGATFEESFSYSIDDQPVNLTGYTARMQVRLKHSSSTALVSLDTDEGITLDSQGNINLLIPANTTKLFPAKDYVYDLELISNEHVYRILEGVFSVTPEVTRD